MGQKIGFDPAKFSAKDFAIKVTADAAAKTAVYGGSFQDNLISTAVSNATLVAGAYGAGEIGDLSLTEGGVPKIVLHAALGGLIAEAMGGDFKSGALVGGVNEAIVGYLGDYLLPEGVSEQSVEYIEAKARLIAASQIVGVLTASASGSDVNIAASIAQNATVNNYLDHKEMLGLKDELARCVSDECTAKAVAKYFQIHLANDEALAAMEESGSLADKQAVAMDIEKALYEFQTNGAFSEADPKAHQALVAFHSLNLDSRQAATGQVAAESTKALLEALGLPATPEILAAAAGAAAAYVGGKRVIAGLSENGKPKPAPKNPNYSSADTDSEAGQPYSHPVKEPINTSGPKGGAKAPQMVENISNPPQAPVIPAGWVSRPGRNGGEIYFPAGTDPAKGEHIRVMPAGSSPIPGYEYGYWRWQNSSKQPMNPATGKPGKGQGDTHVPLPPDSLPPTRR